MADQTISSCADWIGIADLLVTCTALGIAFWAAKTAVETLKNQRTTNDVSLALSLFDKINTYWDMAVHSPAQNQYCLGQILAYFETAAGLFNRKVLSKDASEILSHHIIEVWSKMRASPSGDQFINQLRSSATTFDELNKFFREHQSKALADGTFRNGSWDSPIDKNNART
jgi:hypothetical protein